MRNWRDHLDLKKLDPLAPAIFALLIIYVCWKLASLFWLVIAPMQAMQFERVALGSQQQAVPNISHFALFKSKQSATEVSNLNLSLQGVVVSSPSHFSSAVIKTNNVGERYRVGEYIADTNYQLAEVYWDKVILRSPSGADEILKMAAMENLNQDLSLNPQKTPPVVNTAPVMPQNTEQALGNAVQQLQENREQYLQNMGANSDGGEGYQVSARTPLVLRRKLGLQPGDRVLSLNGQRLGAGQNEAQLLEQARQSGQVKLEIQRGDQVITIQQDLN
jgi:general secretion pathway protein C